jgi:hypothetical protein
MKQKMLQPNIVHYCSLINAYARHLKVDKVKGNLTERKETFAFFKNFD